MRHRAPADYYSRMPNSVPSTIRAVQLPEGGKLVASGTLQSQSAGCTAAANLQMQVAPWLAVMSCQFQILKLLKPLIDIVSTLPNPSVPALQEFSKAAEGLLPWLLASAPAGVLPFVRDLLCLEIESLNCLRRNLLAMARLTEAEPSAVSAAEVQSVIDSYQPIAGLLELAGTLLGIAGLDSLQAPALAGGTDPASLAADQETIASFVTTLQTAVDSIGGCQ